MAPMATPPPTPVSRPRYRIGPDHRLIGAPGLQPPLRRDCPNHGGAFSPRLIVLHYTAAEFMDGSIAWLCDRRSKVSAHLVIGRDGALAQLVPFDRQAWHAGRSAWRGTPHLNHYAIGIEMANLGPLGPARVDGKRPAYRTPTGLPLPDLYYGRTAPGAPELAWERYPAPQVRTVVAVCAALQQHYPMSTEVIGHSDCAVPAGRKLDPGPAWDWAAFRAALTAANA